jgi:hypothetical protein
MSPATFAAWLDHMKERRGWSARRCAAELGCGENQPRVWLSRTAPRYIALACAALASELPEWTEKTPKGEGR